MKDLEELKRCGVLEDNPRILILCTEGTIRRGQVQIVESKLRNFKVSRLTCEPGYPNINSCLQLADVVNFFVPQVIIALGGGSVIDSAKAVASILRPGLPENWFISHLKNGQEYFEDCLVRIKIIAIPTTAGTGSEVTKWATIWDEEKSEKCSISSSQLYPCDVFLEPEFTKTLNKKQTMIGALDALSHALDSIWNLNATDESIDYASRAIKIILEDLPKVIDDSRNIADRTNLLLASHLAGKAINITKTSLAHSMSYHMTLKCNLPHGLACSLTLPEIIQFSAKKNKQVVDVLNCSNEQEAVELFYNFFKEIGIKDLIHQFKTGDSILGEVEPSCLLDQKRLKNYPHEISSEEAYAILKESLTKIYQV